MSDDSEWDNLDRRHFMAAAIGASAVLAADVDKASAQATNQTATRPGGTAYTGDVIDGKKIISALNIDDLEPGKGTISIFKVHRWRPGNIGMFRP
jgi:hypothetical protein